jgi:hypothetical protein
LGARLNELEAKVRAMDELQRSPTNVNNSEETKVPEANVPTYNLPTLESKMKALKIVKNVYRERIFADLQPIIERHHASTQYERLKCIDIACQCEKVEEVVVKQAATNDSHTQTENLKTEVC